MKNKLSTLLAKWKGQKVGMDEAGEKSINRNNGSNFTHANSRGVRKAEGRIITPIEPAFRRKY